MILIFCKLKKAQKIWILIFRAKVSGLWNGRVHFWKKIDASILKWTRPFSKWTRPKKNGRVHFQKWTRPFYFWTRPFFKMDASIFRWTRPFSNGRVHFFWTRPFSKWTRPFSKIIIIEKMDASKKKWTRPFSKWTRPFPKLIIFLKNGRVHF